MQLKTNGTGRLLLYGLLVGVVLYYAVLLPIAIMGYWRNYLTPSTSMITNFAHVYIIVIVWALTRSKRAVLIATGIVLVGMFALQFVLGGWPTVEMIPKFGYGNYFANWTMTLLPLFVAPIVASILLMKADAIAPRIFKEWTNVYD